MPLHAVALSEVGVTIMRPACADRPQWRIPDRQDWAMTCSVLAGLGRGAAPPGRVVSRWPARAGRFGAWRALVQLPSLLGGVVLSLVLTAALGRWQGLALMVWLSVGVLLSTPVGERLAVRLALGFRPLSTSQRQLLEPVSAAALARCGLPGGAVDWYVQAGGLPNACAAGRRTVAVTQGALDNLLAGRLPADLFAAVLVHELGHHATRAGRYGLAASWYSAPGRVAYRLVVSLAVLACDGRRPGRGTGLVVAVAGAVALVQSAQHGQWLSVAILSAVAFALLVTPLLDGLVSRASEHAADRYAVSVGAGPDLAGALQLLAGLTGARRGVAARLLDRHPSVAERLARLDGSCGALPR